MGADRDGLHRHAAVAAVQKLERSHQGRLGLHCDHPRAEPAEAGDAIADMRADVENEIAGPDELGIEPIHGSAASPIAVIDAQGAHDATKRSPSLGRKSLEHPYAARSIVAISMAGNAKTRNSGGGAVSSGNRPIPSRISARPTF